MRLRLLPVPRRIERQSGGLRLGGPLALRVEPPDSREAREAAERLRALLEPQTRSAAAATAPTSVGVRLLPSGELPAQGYRLHIEREGITLEAPDAAGLRYATETLRQIALRCDAELPGLEIHDWPDLAVRGYMLDISRDRVPTQVALRELVSTLRTLRINQLQLYTEHSFAYREHRRVWEHASPMQPEEIRELDSLCRENGIELVPNQNSFGHMERWLRHPEYRHLAECPEGSAAPDGSRRPPQCLTPTHESLDFMDSLYDELLPCFASRSINIGCDETFELGRGRSREACERDGKGRVYLGYLRALIERLARRGYTVQFWGDIVRQHPEQVAELPRDGLVSLVWGYEAPQDPDGLPEDVRKALAAFGLPAESLRGFAWRVRPFAEAGIPFYVCPGTSSWNSLVGRWPNARANLLDAARIGHAQGAQGLLITDWGDNGHLQPPVVSLPPLAYGAAVSWCAASNADLDVESVLDLLLSPATDGTTARSLLRLGSLYGDIGLRSLNGSPAALALLTPAEGRLPAWGTTDARELGRLVGRIESEREELARRPADDLEARELTQAARLLRHGSWRLEQLMLGTGPSPEALRRDLAECSREQERVWRLRSRPGGLQDSLARLRGPSES